MKAQVVHKLPRKLEREVSEVDKLLASGQKNIVLDFSQCQFVNVEGLEWLEELLMRSQSSAANVSFANVRPEQYKVFKTAHIESLLNACGALARTGPVC